MAAKTGDLSPVLQKEYLLTPDAARFLSLSAITLKSWRWRSRLEHRRIGPPYIKVGLHRVVYRLADLQRWMKTQELHTRKFASRRRAA